MLSTLAREVLFKRCGLNIDTFQSELGRTIGEKLLEPTTIHVRPINKMINNLEIHVKALIHITSDGFLNLTRVEAKVGFVVDCLPESQPIISVIQSFGNDSDEEMFRVCNMGIGFCVIVSEKDVDKVRKIAKKHGAQNHIIGYTLEDPEQQVSIKPKSLIGKKRKFFKV